MEGLKVEKIETAHKDERRELIPMFNGDFTARQIKVLKIKKGSVLGNHYHEYHETFYLLEGEAHYFFEDVKTKEKQDVYLRAGERITIRPRIAHKAEFIKDTIMIEGTEDPYVSKEVNDKFYDVKDTKNKIEYPQEKEGKKAKSLITGIGGFVASHLADLLVEKGEEVVGTYRWTEDMSRIKQIEDKIKLVAVDLLDQMAIYRCLKENKPDYIFHLAAQSYVSDSFTNPDITINVNTMGTLRLLEAIRVLKEQEGYDPVVHVCSSSEVYGLVTEDLVPIKESCRFNPSNPYAVGKVGEDMIALMYWTNFKIKTIRTRMFTHSVSRFTPVILRKDKKLVDIKYISELRSSTGGGNALNKIWNMEKENLEVWNDSIWTKIKHLSCHPIRDNKMLEITCRGGTIDATDNHSIINEKGLAVEAKSLKKSDKVKIVNLPNSEVTEISKELAWLYGFFVAEGDFSRSKFRIANKNRDLLEKARKIMIKCLGIDSRICKEKKGMLRLSGLQCGKFVQSVYDDFYAPDKNKRIPKIILNAKNEIKKEFLRGYNDGDGDLKNKVKSEFYRFKTKSPILAMGVCYLLNCVNIRYRIHIEHRKDKRYYEIRCLTQLDTKNGRWLLKGDNEITKITEIPYKGEVWDFETENHWFHAGIGGNIVHNTGPRRTMMSAECAFARQIARIEKGLQEPVLKHGNLNSVRTWADVRDAVRAYWLLVRKCKPGEVYNIGGDTTKTIGEMLDYLISLSPMKDKIKKEQDPKLLRPYDVTLQIPDISKFANETGWKPEYNFERTMQDLLDWWRKKV